MKNGTERRPNGALIVQYETQSGFKMYRVTNGPFIGSWDYLCNARDYADTLNIDPYAETALRIRVAELEKENADLATRCNEFNDQVNNQDKRIAELKRVLAGTEVCLGITGYIKKDSLAHTEIQDVLKKAVQSELF